MKIIFGVIVSSSILLGIGCASLKKDSPEMVQLKNAYKRPDSIPYPEDNKYSKAKDELGKILFFDPRLSGSNMISCASCHNPSFGWEDGLELGVGHGHKKLGRSTPTIINLAWAPRLFWDGRARNLEHQALGPIESSGEMNMAIGDLPKKLEAISEYKVLFEKAFPGQKISNDLVAKAIATYERGVVSGKSKFDKWIEGNSSALSPQEVRGFALFNNKAKCASCHSGWRFTDDSFHDIGLKSNDLGRGKFYRKIASQQHAFKTPGLRSLPERAPYMHDGSEKTLEQVVDFYDRGGDVKRKSLSHLITPLGLSKSEKKDLVAFLKTLDSKSDQPVSLPVLPK